MWVGLVVGNVVATNKDHRLVGHKLMLVRRYSPTGSGANDELVVAVDKIGAGIGEQVLVVCGSSARRAVCNEDCPVDNAIVGIVDGLELDRRLLTTQIQE